MVETTHCTDDDSADISLHQSIGTREILERMKNLRGPLYRLGLENGMNGNLEMLTRIAAVMLGIVALLVTAVLIYAAYLGSKLQRLVGRLPHRPQVERDYTGRRLKEPV